MEVAGFEEIKKIAEGPYHVIFSAKRLMDQKPIVLKMLSSRHPSVDTIALMYHEYEISKDLKVPEVIETYDIIDHQGQYALVQEDMNGISLEDYLRQKPITNLAFFLKLAIQMAHIIGQLHKNHIIHKDIKPSNFIINPDTFQIKITGLNFSSKLLHETQDILQLNHLEGTLEYMAPEQTGRMNMSIDYRSDFYALGVTFFEMLTGKLPFLSSDPIELVHAHLTNPVPELLNITLNIPKAISKIVEKLMAKEPGERYQSAIGLQVDLEHCEELLENTGKVDPFTLGQGEVSDHLNLSQKLYGRENEIKILLSKYDLASRGSVEALMVSGYSGIGKTMLINEVHRPMVQHRGYFISGKFDQMQRDMPYTAIMQAFNHLARLILAEPEERFNVIKREIIDAMGSVAQVIIDLAPDLRRILGPQPALEELPPRQTQDRMMIFLRRFLHVISTKDHPLVLFIDDLQWADTGSLKILEYILTDDGLSHFFLIGAYRDNEVDESHPLHYLLFEMKKQGKAIGSLHLAPLAEKDFQTLLIDTLHRKEEIIKPFSDLIYKRTDGNPFFFKQIINTLYKENILFFDYNRREWYWKLDEFLELKISSNVVDFMLSKLANLPDETQNLLKLAACLGNRFSIAMLTAISGHSAIQIGRSLWVAVQQEIIITQRLGYKRVEAMSHESYIESLSNDITYQFAHDRIQQAIYCSITKEDKIKTHYKIARLISEQESEAYKKEHLFEIIDHYNQAHELLDQNERIHVMKLNYLAAVRARNGNAYQPMLSYVRAGLALSNINLWESDYDFIFKLNREHVYALFLTGAVEEAGSLTEGLLLRARSILDKASIYRVQSLYYLSVGNVPKALESGSKGLNLLGVKIPKKPSWFAIQAKNLRLKIALSPYKIETLDKSLKKVVDEKTLFTFQMMSEISLPIVWSPGNIDIYFGLESMLLMMRSGSPPNAGLWVTIYALAVLRMSKNVEYAFRLWDLAKRYMDQEGDKYTSTISYAYGAFFIKHLRNSFTDAHPYCQKIIQDALESGNLISSATGMLITASTIMAEGNSLPILRDYLLKALDYSRKIHYQMGIEALEARLSVVEGLMMESPSIDWQLKTYNVMQQSKNFLYNTMSSQYMCMYMFFLDSFKEACKYHFHWYPGIERVYFGESTLTSLCFAALSFIKYIPGLSYTDRKKYWHHFNILSKDIQWAAQQSPHNYFHQHLMLCGAKSEFEGNNNDAIGFFEAAAKNAKNGGFNNWAAIANEWAGNLSLKTNRIIAASAYFREAHYHYQRYGLTIKVKALENCHPEFFSEETVSERSREALENQRYSHRTFDLTTEKFDFISVLKATQAISGEIILDKLFEKMLHIVMENAGAEKTFFLEKDKSIWKVIAELSREHNLEKFEILNIPFKEFGNLPKNLIQFVIRSKEAVVLQNATENKQYQQDPYFLQTQTKSILCLPVIHQENVIGIIYLENNQTAGVFTQERIKVLETLAAQIAISLENARQLEHLENLNKKTERFVPKAFLKFLLKESVEDVELGESAEAVLTILFTDIRGYTTLSEKQSPKESFAFINAYLKATAPVIRSHNGFINQFQGDGILALFPKSPDDAVRAVLELNSALQEFNRRQADLGKPSLKVGYGLNTGPAMLGTIGEEERMEANVIGDAINLASRVEGLNKIYGTEFIISDATKGALTSTYTTRLLDKVRVKGKMNAIYIYEVYFQDNIDDSERLFIDTYENAFRAYEKGDFMTALAGFKECLNQKSEDAASTLMSERTLHCLEKPVPEHWDGTYNLEYK